MEQEIRRPEIPVKYVGCAEIHKKSFEVLQRRNWKLLQQIDCLQGDYERASEELEEEWRQQLLTAKEVSSDAMRHHHTLNQLLLVFPKSSVELKNAHFRKVIVLSHADKGGGGEMFYQAHRNFRSQNLFYAK